MDEIDPLREQQVKKAQAGVECRRFLSGIGGAAITQMREAIIDQLTALKPKQDEDRYRLTVALGVVNRFSDTVLRAAVEGEESAVEVRHWLEINERKGLFGGR